MKSKLLLGTSTLLLSLCAAQALADPASGERWPRWYLGLSGGMSFLKDSDLKGASTGSLSYNDGSIITASLGYRPALENAFANGFRFELEGGYHNNSLDSAVISGTPTVVSKHVRIWSAMGNAFYDFRNESQWTPYIGAGAGWADVDLPTTSGLGNVDNDDKTFAYQFMGGLAFSPTTIPLTEWTLGYRYFALNNAKFSTGGGSKLKLDNYGSHNVELGARFRF